MAKDPFEHNFESATGQIALDRAPRVHIEYSVFKGGATLKEQIPFVMGVMAPLRGDRAATDAPADRDFREITRQTFDEEMRRQKPTAKVEIDNPADNGKTKLQLDLSFESMDEFSPAAVARKVDSLRQMLELRTQLKDIRARIGAKPAALDWLTKIIKNEDVLKELRQKIGSDAGQTPSK